MKASVIVDGKKRCSKCGEIKDYQDYQKDSSTKDGLFRWCRDCSKQQSKAWKNKNKDKVSDYNKKYAGDHPEDRKIRWSYYYELNKQILLSKRSVFREENKETVKQRDRGYYWSNPEKRRQQSCDYRKRNPDKVKFYSQKRRSRKRNVLSTLTIQEWEWILDLCGNKCLRCGSSDFIEQDHIIPLDPGQDTLENIQPLCRKCNISKRRTTKDYRPSWIIRLVNDKVRCQTQQQLQQPHPQVFFQPLAA